jgi:hypothetical protein
MPVLPQLFDDPYCTINNARNIGVVLGQINKDVLRIVCKFLAGTQKPPYSNICKKNSEAKYMQMFEVTLARACLSFKCKLFAHQKNSIVEQ